MMVVRPGFVRTKMTVGRKATPFAIDVSDVAEAVVRGLERGTEVVWAPSVLRYVFGVRRAPPTLALAAHARLTVTRSARRGPAVTLFGAHLIPAPNFAHCPSQPGDQHAERPQRPQRPRTVHHTRHRQVAPQRWSPGV